MPAGAENKDINSSTLSTKEKLVFPTFPQENQILSHQAFKWHERAIRELTAAGLFKVATLAAMPDSIEEVRDRPVPGVLPAAHREYARREEKIMDIVEYNRGQQRKRLRLWLESWTSLHTALLDCTEETAPALHLMLKENCNMTHIDPTYFDRKDGPRAWVMIEDFLASAANSKFDKRFYRAAEALQRERRLPDGCSAADYLKKALAFKLYIQMLDLQRL